eukprot:12035732-Ditylum_brightwellii.AAC.1
MPTSVSNLVDAKTQVVRMLKRDCGKFVTTIFNKASVSCVTKTESIDTLMQTMQLNVIEDQLYYMGKMSNEENDNITNEINAN